MDYSKSLTLSEYLALPSSLEEVTSELASRLPDGFELLDLTGYGACVVAEIDGLHSVLDVVELAAVVDGGVLLQAVGDVNVAILECTVAGERVVVRREFPLETGASV